VEVDADSLYEAVALAVAEFRNDEIITDAPAPMTEFCATVLRKPVEHRVRFKKVQEWGPALNEKRTRRDCLAGAAEEAAGT
jgi:hypothetical protein